MSDPRKDIRRAVVSAAGTLAVLGVAIVAVSRTDVGREALVDLASRARLGALVVAGLFMASAFVPLALRWRALMPVRPPVLGLTAVISTGLLLNFTMPGPVGELGSAWLAHRRYDVSFAAALASGVAGRITGLFSAALVAALTWLAFDLPVPESFRPAVTAAAVVMAAGGAALAWLAARPTWWKAVVARVTSPWDARAGRWTERIRGAVGGLADALGAVATAGPLAWAGAIGWALVAHAVVAFGAWWLLTSLGGPVQLEGVVFALCAAIAGTVVAFLLPSSQLAFDGIFLALLVATAGASLPDAAATAVLLRVSQVGAMITGALVTAWLPIPDAEG